MESLTSVADLSVCTSQTDFSKWHHAGKADLSPSITLS
jgi:hypothetical protein